MKILFDHPNPFLLAHGGFQIQIEQTKRALESLGMEVEFLRWWDSAQTSDLIHYFGRPSGSYIDFAHAKGIRVVIAELVTGLGSRPPSARVIQRLGIRAVRKSFPFGVWSRMGWDAYAKADLIVALTNWEAQLMRDMFDAPAQKLVVVPNGVDEPFLQTPATEISRGPYLVCTATITERKRVLELAYSAIRARTPLWVIGTAYGDGDSYASQFFQIARRSPEIIRYEGAVRDRSQLAQIYRQARGFVLLSTMESLSLSALEAAACECPLLLSDLPWARTTFKNAAMYCPVSGTQRTAKAMREFYDAAPSLPRPPRPSSWDEVARQIKGIYENLVLASKP